MRTAFGVLGCVVALSLFGCSTLTLRPADFSWPVEERIVPDKAGNIQDLRYQITMNVKPLLFEELKDSNNVTGRAIRFIRDQSGYYFVTARDFKNVYVFYQDDGALKLDTKISVSAKGLEAPALNQKAPFIQLVNENDEKTPPIYLSKNGIQEGGTK